jgi:TPR repeat protein
MLAFGRGTAADPAAAVPLLRSACGPADEQSCAVLASVMLESTPANPEALQVARASCERGYGSSCLLAADAAPSEADSFLRKACDLQEASGCVDVAWKLAAANDFAAARPMFMKGCSAGDDDACNSLAGLLLGGRMGPRDETEALRVAKIGCDAGGEKSCDLVKTFSVYADPHRKFTSSVAGFAFGITLAEAHRRCAAAHGSWIPTNGDLVCTAQPVQTFAEGTPISLEFCGGKLCEVMAFTRHGVDEATEILGKLIDKYGDPGIAEGPSTIAAQRSTCAAGDKTQLRRVWYFRPPDRGETIGRLIFTSTCEDALYSVIYQDATGVQHRIGEYEKVQANY